MVPHTVGPLNGYLKTPKTSGEMSSAEKRRKRKVAEKKS